MFRLFLLIINGIYNTYHGLVFKCLCIVFGRSFLISSPLLSLLFNYRPGISIYMFTASLYCGVVLRVSASQWRGCGFDSLSAKGMNIGLVGLV